MKVIWNKLNKFTEIICKLNSIERSSDDSKLSYQNIEWAGIMKDIRTIFTLLECYSIQNCYFAIYPRNVSRYLSSS